MSDDPKLGVVKKEEHSALALSPRRSAIVARGRRDAALMGECYSCGQARVLVFAACVCTECIDELDRQWAGSTVTDWVLGTFRGPQPVKAEDGRSRLSEFYCLSEDFDGPVEDLEVFTKDSFWPVLYVYTDTPYEQMKQHWARRAPPDSLCIGPMTIGEFAFGAGIPRASEAPCAPYEDGKSLYTSPWPHGRRDFFCFVPFIRPATAKEIDLSKSLAPNPNG
jgi:hypothetical protein